MRKYVLGNENGIKALYNCRVMTEQRIPLLPPIGYHYFYFVFFLTFM
jgi:hypothetical protein